MSDARNLTDRTAPVAEVEAAARRIADADMPSARWAAIADDPSFGLAHRRIAAFELLRRHLRPGMTARDISGLLGRPGWLEDRHIQLLQDIGGRPPPVAMTAGDSVFRIDVLPGPEPVIALWSVYLRMQGAVDRDAFSAVLRLGAENDAAAAVVLEVAALPP
jgi:hypothetical protein